MSQKITPLFSEERPIKAPMPAPSQRIFALLAQSRKQAPASHDWEIRVITPKDASQLKGAALQSLGIDATGKRLGDRR